MAKMIIVGSSERKGSFCPQCRKKVAKANRLENGIHCTRCGFFRWEEFSKYPSLDGIPVPKPKDEIKADDFFETGSLMAAKKKRKQSTKEVKK
jgi:ribosomal protein S27AE